jgi:hypothetical protein
MNQMSIISKIEVWFDKSHKCWYVTTYNEENTPCYESAHFYKKSDAITYAQSLLPKLIIETRK